MAVNTIQGRIHNKSIKFPLSIRNRPNKQECLSLAFTAYCNLIRPIWPIYKGLKGLPGTNHLTLWAHS